MAEKTIDDIQLNYLITKLIEKIDDKAEDEDVEKLNEYILNIDYENTLAFDTSEIVIDVGVNTTSVLGQAILGQMLLR